MKEKLIEFLTTQKKEGSNLTLRLEQVTNSKELGELIIDYESWDKKNLEVLKKAFVAPQLFQIYSGVTYLSNVYIEKGSFQDNREKLIYSLPKKISHLTTAINTARALRNIDLLPFDEEILAPKTIIQSTNMKKLFISHSSIDKEIIMPLIDLVEGIGVPHHQIFYSSHPAYGVKLGQDIFQRLKLELDSDDLYALFILSKHFYESPVCLCEMGAVWIKSNRQTPILIPPFDFSDVKGVFSNSLGFKINDKDLLSSFKEELESYFELTPIHVTRWETKRDDYLIKINGLIHIT